MLNWLDEIKIIQRQLSIYRPSIHHADEIHSFIDIIINIITCEIGRRRRRRRQRQRRRINDVDTDVGVV